MDDRKLRVEILQVLANEWLASGIARVLGLPLPSCEIVNVDASSIATTAELKSRHACYEEPCAAGLQFGTGFLGGTLPGLTAVDYLPEEHLSEVSNLGDFHGSAPLFVTSASVVNRNSKYDLVRDAPMECD